jgi:ZIP family zinc transporter
MGLSGTEIAGMVLPGLATGLGGLLLVVLRRPSARTLAAVLGLTAGIMLAASFFGLLAPALEAGTLGEVVAGFALGCAALFALDIAVPHLHERFVERGHENDAADAERRGAQRRAILLLSALTIHNLPEGLAVGLAFAAGGVELGLPTAIAIGLQNVPEGFAAAAPLRDAGVSTPRAVGFAFATGAVEPPAALLAGVVATGLAGVVLAGGLAFAAGAMVYVVVDELIPESHAGGFEREATLGLLAGFLVMMVLDTALA